MENKYKLTGVGCMKCVNKIETNLSQLPGIESVHVDVDSKIMDISYDENIINFNKIEEKLVDLGYG